MNVLPYDTIAAVARGIYDHARGQDGELVAWERLGEDAREDFMADAREALAALDRSGYAIVPAEDAPMRGHIVVSGEEFEGHRARVSRTVAMLLGALGQLELDARGAIEHLAAAEPVEAEALSQRLCTRTLLVVTEAVGEATELLEQLEPELRAAHASAAEFLPAVLTRWAEAMQKEAARAQQQGAAEFVDPDGNPLRLEMRELEPRATDTDRAPASSSGGAL